MRHIMYDLKQEAGDGLFQEIEEDVLEGCNALLDKFKVKFVKAIRTEEMVRTEKIDETLLVGPVT